MLDVLVRATGAVAVLPPAPPRRSRAALRTDRGTGNVVFTGIDGQGDRI